MITCQDILELQLDGVELIAGEEGLTRPVTWTYMVQTRPFEEHMNQGNFALCVVDYVRLDLEEAGKAMEELYGLGISGFGISITDDKEPVPKEMITKPMRFSSRCFTSGGWEIILICRLKKP